MLSTQPLEERSHHLGAAEALETCSNIFVVPLQSTDLQDSDKGNDGDRIDAVVMWMCLLCHTKQRPEVTDSYGEQTKWSAGFNMRSIAWCLPDIGWGQWKGLSVRRLIWANNSITVTYGAGTSRLYQILLLLTKRKTGVVEEIWAVTVEMTAAKTSIKAACAAKTWERHRTFSCWMKSVAHICYHSDWACFRNT